MSKNLQMILIAVGIAVALFVGYKFLFASAMDEAAKKAEEARLIAERARQAADAETQKNISDSLAGFTGIFGAPQIGRGIGDLLGQFVTN